jgi:hypothetical protein
MVELEFNPQVGDKVLVYPHEAKFEIVDRHSSAAGELLLKLRRLPDGKIFENVPPILVDYPSDEKVRRALNKIASGSNDWPEEFQARRFKVVTNEMYDGTPRIVAYFYLRPEVAASPESARARNDFYRKLHSEIDPLVDSGVWLQFMTREERGELSAAG